MKQSSLTHGILTVVLAATVLTAAKPVAAAAGERVVLASGGKTDYVVVVPADAAPTVKFAAEELAKYVRKMGGGDLPIRATGDGAGKRILFESGDTLGVKLGAENYAIVRRGDDLVIAATPGRATLYAVYDLLERLGCRWLAPKFSFYQDGAEFVPHKSEVVLDLPGSGMIVAPEPHFAIRKLDVEEGLSHNAENMKQLVEWAPKLRYNTLMVPRDYGGRGRVTWDQWRDAITPEAQKRGLIIEVGGHGYENFLNAEMDGGRIFREQAEWFGKDEKGERSKAKRQVFCTSNKAAVDFVTRGVIDYLASRREIRVFELWPPDGADWCTCDACAALGEPQDRQALLINHVQDVLAKERPDVRLEIIAYSKALLPPTKVKVDRRVLVDYCPINQCFEVPINDSSSERNAEYVAAVTAWRKQFAGDIGLYSYYRKYAWRSLPALLPHYMQADLRFYRTLPLQATMIYAEPGDWATYEVNHYVLGKLSWDADADVGATLDAFCAARYGDETAGAARELIVLLGDTVRTHGSLPFTRLKTPEGIAAAKSRLEAAAERLPKGGPAYVRLHLAVEYAVRDLAIQQLRAAKAPQEEIRKQVESLVAFHLHHKDDGVFIVNPRSTLDRYLKRYGLPADRIEVGE